MQLTLDKIESAQHATREENIKLNVQLSSQGASLKSMQSELKKFLRETAKYWSLYEVLRDEKFVGTSQNIWMELTCLLDDPLPKGDL